MDPKFFSRPRRDIWTGFAQLAIIALFATLALPATGYACCPNTPNAPGLLNLGYITPGCGDFNNVSCNSFSMCRVNVRNGFSYTFTTCATPGNPDLEISIYNDATGAVVAWNDNNGSVCTGLKASLTYTANFNGTLRIFINDKVGGNCSSTANYSNVIFGVKQNKGVSITTSDSPICLSNKKTLSVSPSVSGTWSIVSGGGSISSGKYTPSSPGVKVLKFTYGACAPTLTFTVFSNFSAGNITGGGGTFAGSADPAPMTANTSGGNGAGTISWYYFNGTTCPTGSCGDPAQSGTLAGTGTVFDPPAGLTVTRSYRYYASGFGCNDGWSSNCVTVTVTPCNLSVSASASANAVCEGESVALSATGASTYLWSNGSTAANMMVFPNTTQTYTVTGTNAAGCTATQTVTVNVSPLSTLNLPKPVVQACANGKVELTANGADQIIWENGAATGETYVRSFSQSTWVKVTGVSAGSCPVTDSIFVDLGQTPTLSATVSATEVRVGEPVHFHAEGNGNIYWQSMEYMVNGADFSYAFPEPGVYHLQAVATSPQLCTTVSETFSINVLPRPRITLLPFGDQTLPEGAAAGVTYQVELSYAQNLPVSVDVVFDNSQVKYNLAAQNDEFTDYNSLPEQNDNRLTLHFTQNGIQTFTLLPIDNSLSEALESIYFELQNAVNADIIRDSASATLTIMDDDGQATLRFLPAPQTMALNEGNQGATVYPLSVELDRCGVFPYTVQLNLSGTATYGSDFATLPAAQDNMVTLVFLQNGVQTFDVSINGDAEIEDNENVKFEIAPQPAFVFVYDPSREFILLNDDNELRIDCTTLPANQSWTMDGTVATLSWDATPYGAAYEIRYRIYGQNGDDSYVYVTTGAPSVVLNTLLPVTTYEWQVRALCIDGSSSVFTEVAYFVTEGTPEACLPPNNLTATPTETGVTFAWDAVSNTGYYQVQYRRANTAVWTTVQTNTNGATVNGLLPATNYQWRVRTFCGSPASNFSTIQTFATGSSARIAKAQPQAETPAPTFSMTVYPNPNNGVFEAEAYLETNGQATFRMYNLAGQTIQENLVPAQAGRAVQAFDLTEQPKGLYLLEIRAGQNAATAKIVVR